jgi:hypothetical protein
MFQGYDKHKIPKTESFPVSRSVVEEGLASIAPSKLHMLYFWRKHSGPMVMRADYLGEQSRGWHAAGLTSVTVYAVSLEERKQIAEAVAESAIPALAAWLAKAEKAANVWRTHRHSWVCSAENGRLTFSET